MVVCARCQGSLTKARVCETCGRAYCLNETLDTCQFCDKTLANITVEQESLPDELTIQWIYKDRIKLGLVGFERVPSILFNVETMLRNKGKELGFDVVFALTKEISNKVAYSLKRRFATLEEEELFRKPTEISRYTLITDQKSKKKYVLLNVGGLRDSSVRFLLSFFRASFEKLGIVIDKSDHDIIEVVGSIFFLYNKKFGIDFVVGNKQTVQFAQTFSNNMKMLYVEFLAAKEIVKIDNLGEAAQFFGQKIDNIFEPVEWEEIAKLIEICKLFAIAVQASMVLAAVDKFGPLKLELTRKVESYYDVWRKNLQEYPDIIKAVEAISQVLKGDEVFSTYENFQKSLAVAFKKASEILEPHYVKLDEALTLAQVAQDYVRAISIGFPLVTQFGNVNDYAELLERIFERRDVYPEIPIIAGKMLLEVLLTKIIHESDYAAYCKSIAVVRQFSELVEKSIPEIRLKNGPRGENPGSVLDYQDVVLELLTFSQMAKLFDEQSEAEILYKEAYAISERYNLLPLKVTILWKDFVSTHDYQKLNQIHRLCSGIDYTLGHKHFKPHIEMLRHLTMAIYERERRRENFDKAEECCLEMISHPMPDYSEHALKSSMSHQLLIALFAEIMKADETSGASLFETVRRASVRASALSEELSPMDPLLTLALKTKLLNALVKGDAREVSDYVKSFEKLGYVSPQIKNFLDLVKRWFSLDQKRAGSNLIQILDFPIDNEDPWSRIALGFMKSQVEAKVKESIIVAESIVFVEGPIDVKIYEAFLEKLCPSSNVRFIDAGGWPTIKYFAESKVAQGIPAPVYVIFDGDTEKRKKNEEIKARLMKELKLEETHIITLREYSIESYLLVPNAIKRAFPQIGMTESEMELFFKQNEGKKNKKSVIDSLLKTCGLQKYDGDIGAQIARNMKAEEVHAEIKEILQLIVS